MQAAAVPARSGAGFLQLYKESLATSPILTKSVTCFLGEPQAQVFAHWHLRGCWVAFGADWVGGEVGWRSQTEGLDVQSRVCQLPGLPPPFITICPALTLGRSVHVLSETEYKRLGVFYRIHVCILF